jgi:hypothetical protein
MAMCINAAKTKIILVGRGAPQLFADTPNPLWFCANGGVFQVFGRHYQLLGQLVGGG